MLIIKEIRESVRNNYKQITIYYSSKLYILSYLVMLRCLNLTVNNLLFILSNQIREQLRNNITSSITSNTFLHSYILNFNHNYDVFVRC